MHVSVAISPLCIQQVKRVVRIDLSCGGARKLRLISGIGSYWSVCCRVTQMQFSECMRNSEDSQWRYPSVKSDSDLTSVAVLDFSLRLEVDYLPSS